MSYPFAHPQNLPQSSVELCWIIPVGLSGRQWSGEESHLQDMWS